MAIQRLAAVRPATNVSTGLYTFQHSYLISIIVTNISPSLTPIPKIVVYVAPSGSSTEGSYVYIADNLTVGYGVSFETFRFAVNPGDAVFVRSSTDSVSFSLYGILQDDAVGQGDLAQTFTNKIVRGVNNTVYVDKGTTGERRGDAEEGYVRYNTEFEALEIRTSTTWEPVGSGSGSGSTGPAGPAGPAYNAIATLDVSNNGSGAYQFNSHYTGDNPSIYALSGASLCFDLTNVSESHPFQIQLDTGGGYSNITSGLTHVEDDGTVSTGSLAQGKTSGKLFWEVAISSPGTWRYICSVHPAMTGALEIRSLSA
jgi:hypothetical protein